MTVVGHIRPMAAGDVDRVAELETSTYAQPWSAAMFHDELAGRGRTYLVAVTDDRVVGYGGVMIVGDEAHVTTLVVAPEARRSRLGMRLMLELVEAAVAGRSRSLTLEVRESNAAARTLYERFGMTSVGRRKQYYRDEDALIMWVHRIDTAEYRERLDALAAEIRPTRESSGEGA